MRSRYNWWVHLAVEEIARATGGRASGPPDREVDGALDPGTDLAEQVVALGRAYARHARTNADTWKMLSRSGLLDHPSVLGARADRVERIAIRWGDTPEAHLAAWSVTGAEKAIGSPASRTPAPIRSRQSLWISPER